MIHYRTASLTTIRHLSRATAVASALAPVSDAMLVSLSMGHRHQESASAYGAPASQLKLVDDLQCKNLIRSQEVLEAMKKVDRADYIVNPTLDRRINVYSGDAVYFSSQRPERLSNAIMHAIALEALFPAINERLETSDNKTRCVLDIAAGTGYMAKCLSLILESKVSAASSRVIAVERNLQLIQHSPAHNLEWVHADAFSSDEWMLQLRKADCSISFDVIHVGAAIEAVPDWMMELMSRKHGRLVAPIGPEGCEQQLTMFERFDDKWTRQVLMHCAYERAQTGTIDAIMDCAIDKCNDDDVKLRQMLEQTLRNWHSEFRTENNRLPSLQDMKNDSTILEILRKLPTLK